MKLRVKTPAIPQTHSIISMPFDSLGEVVAASCTPTYPPTYHPKLPGAIGAILYKNAVGFVHVVKCDDKRIRPGSQGECRQRYMNSDIRVRTIAPERLSCKKNTVVAKELPKGKIARILPEKTIVLRRDDGSFVSLETFEEIRLEFSDAETVEGSFAAKTGNCKAFNVKALNFSAERVAHFCEMEVGLLGTTTDGKHIFKKVSPRIFEVLNGTPYPSISDITLVAPISPEELYILPETAEYAKMKTGQFGLYESRVFQYPDPSVPNNARVEILPPGTTLEIAE